MLILLVLAPLVAAAISFVIPSNRVRPWLLPAGATLQLALAYRQINGPDVQYDFQRWLASIHWARSFWAW